MFGTNAYNGGNSNAMGGYMDEIRIEPTARSADWISLCYQTQSTTSTDSAAIATSLPASIVSNGSLIPQAAPGAPTLAAPSSGTTGTSVFPTMSWSAGSGGTPSAYALQISTSSGFSTTVYDNTGSTSPQTVGPALLPMTTYYWEVQATNSNATGFWSGVWSFTTGYQPPLAPSLSSPTNTAQNQPIAGLSLNWSSSSRRAGDLLSGSGDDRSDVLIQRSIAGVTLSATSLALPTLANGTPYYWNVAATGPGGTTWAAAWTFTTIVAAPGAPALASPADSAQGQPLSLALSWNSVSNAVSYHLTVSTISDFSTTVISLRGLTAGTSQTVSGLVNNATYYWRVGAKDIGGVSTWSGVWSFGTLSHFAVFDTNTGNNMTVLVPTSINPVLNGSLIQSGDEIAVFNHTGLCVGDAVWRDTNTAVTVWGQNPQHSLTVDGMADSEVLKYRMWDVVHSIEMAAVPTYFTTVQNPEAHNDSLYVSGGISILSSLQGISAPVAPTLLAPTNASGNVSISPTLSWNSVNTAVSYHLNVSVMSNFSTTVYDLSGLTGTAQPLTGLTNSTTYYWEVGAKNAGGVSGWSGAWSFTTIIAAPGAPQLALPTNGATGEPVALNLSWNSVSTAVSYHLTVSAGTDFTTTVFSQGGLTGTSQALSGLLANSTAYIWRVGAKDIGGVSTWSSVWTFTTILSTPVLASPINASGNVSISPTLSWNSVNTAVSYHLNVSVVSDFSTTVYDLSGLTGTAQPLTGLANSTTYYWEVGAKDGSGLVSGWSLTRSFTTIIAAPGAPQLALPTNGATGEPVALNLSWNSVSTAVSYHLTVSAGTDFTTTVFSQGGLTGTSQALSGLLTNSTAYIWRVGRRI